MNLKGISGFFIFFFLLINIFKSYCQDIIITKKGQDIPSKVLEISLTTIKFKKFENLNGPIYNISKDDVLMIRYQNGTKELLNGNSIKVENQTIQSQSNGKDDIVKKELNRDEYIQYEKPIKDPLPIIVEQLKNEEQTKIKEKPILQNQELTSEYIKFNKKKYVWGIGALVAAGAGVFGIIQSNNLYSQYKTATTQANSLHGQIESLNVVPPIAFVLAGFSAIEFFIQQSKQNKVVKFKVIPDKNAVSGIRVGLSYSF